MNEMTGLFIDISDYLVDPIEDEVERALRILGVEEYDYYDSKMNSSR